MEPSIDGFKDDDGEPLLSIEGANDVVGCSDGMLDGSLERLALGSSVGANEGNALGEEDFDGIKEAIKLGELDSDGKLEPSFVGLNDTDGNSLGEIVGANDMEG